jgi:hypothetical protein
MTNQLLMSIPSNPSVPGPSWISRAWKRLPDRLRPAPPAWWFHWHWWVWITITSCILSAHLVALGPSFSWWALIGCVLALHAGWYWGAHSRAIAWALGFAFAFYILVLVEIYLGTTGLYFGAIGSMARPALPGDKTIISIFTCFYRYGSDYRSLLSWLGSIGLYIVLGFALSRTSVSWIADVLAFMLAVFYILLAFPFTHPFEAKQVGIRDAMFESSAALRSIGSYDAAAKEVAKESDQLERLSSELEDAKQVDKRKELSDEVRRYASKLAMLDESRRQKIDILRQPEKTYRSRSVLPKEPRRYPPLSEPDFSSRDADKDASNVNPDDILKAWLLTRQARELAEKAKRDQARGVAAFQDIHDYISIIVIEQIGTMHRADLVEIAGSNVLQIIALHDLEEAINELKLNISKLVAEIETQQRQNADLQQKINDFGTKLAADMGREGDCAETLREVTTWLNGDGRSVLQTIGNRLTRTILEGRQPSLPVNVAPEGANTQLITNEVTQQMVRDNRWPPSFTRESMTGQLLPVSVGGAGSVSEFADAMCKAGRDANDIERELQTVANQVRVPNAPYAPNQLR